MKTRLDSFLSKRKVLAKKRAVRTMRVISVNIEGNRREMIVPSKRITQSFRRSSQNKTAYNVA